ncbi:MAG TPA: formylmethanofuran dehydrogenase subunit C [Gemmatimonadaceae bacterium]|nr:formylmethanofuran dehydrogenase subunit C [Gemmatimonadaceae bacterium]
MPLPLTLTLRHSLEHRIEMDGVTPDRCAGLGEREIAELPVWEGRRTVPLGEFFTVHGGHASSMRVHGGEALDRVDNMGAGMTAGELVIEGNAGRYAGARMSGGSLTVRGNAGDGAGLEMAGGRLEITGRAGDRLGAASLGASRGMLGGEIVVRGSAGAEAGASARRGLIVIGGDAGERAANRMIAGSVIVLGNAGADAGLWSKRGSVVVMGSVEISETYRYDCTYQPLYLRLLFTSLDTRYGIAGSSAYAAARYRRYSGDMAELGKGEILHRAEA